MSNHKGAKWQSTPWERIQRIGYIVTARGCWEWRGDRSPGGYGRVRDYARKLLLVHRVTWSIVNGKPIPDGMVVRHSCDNPPCFNPDHLILGTHADNDHDRDVKGRTANGTRIGASKLTDGQVEQIRAMIAGGATQAHVADIFGIVQSHVSRIINGVNRATPTRRKGL